MFSTKGEMMKYSVRVTMLLILKEAGRVIDRSTREFMTQISHKVDYEYMQKRNEHS